MEKTATTAGPLLSYLRSQDLSSIAMPPKRRYSLGPSFVMRQPSAHGRSRTTRRVSRITSRQTVVCSQTLAVPGNHWICRLQGCFGKDANGNFLCYDLNGWRPSGTTVPFATPGTAATAPAASVLSRARRAASSQPSPKRTSERLPKVERRREERKTTMPSYATEV
jgi:hypothetical protein